MKPPPFDYRRAGSVEEAIALLAEHDGDAKIIAGGQSLVPMLNFRLLAPEVLVDLNPVPGLDAIEAADGVLRIGALVRHHAVETSPEVRRHCPVLGEAMTHVAHLAIRNRGTFGGSLAHADPAAELPLVAVLADAEIRIAGADAARDVAASEFFMGALTTVLDVDEIVTGVRIPAMPDDAGWAFEEFAQRSGDFAIAAAAATVTLRDGAVSEMRIAVTGMGEGPARFPDLEADAAGRVLDDAAIRGIADGVRDLVDPYEDLRASGDYRRHLAVVLARRALERARARAGEGTS